MISNKLLDKKYLRQLEESFANAKPYRHLVIDGFLEPNVAQDLATNFPTLERMKTKYNGINERKAEHSELASLSPYFQQLKTGLFAAEFIHCVEMITGINDLLAIDDRFGYGLHQGGNGSFLDIHIDYNLHPVVKKQRRLNLLIFLNPYWEEEWGGMLQLWNADVTECVTSIAPVFNRCVLFECNEISYHGYNQINCPDNVRRKSFYTYYFSEPISKLSFHDTIFKPLPQDTFIKKIVVTGKERVKNTVKNLLYKLGFLK
ncbi:MAG: 2OG-Fe(II) oxygenase [Flavobacterium sp.]|nr:MAG: 2OG-Fe(II) oxygenase [Flavobacterium sp.]